MKNIIKILFFLTLTVNCFGQLSGGGSGSSSGTAYYKQCQVIDKLQTSTADEGDLIRLDGRLKSTLTPAQQAVATACGYSTNLFDGVGKMLVGSGSGFTPLSTGGSATSIIGQANLPNISLTSNLVSAGTPSGSITNTVTATYHSATGDGFNGGRIQLTDRAGFFQNNPSEMTVSSSFSGTALGTHQHTSSLGGSGTALSTQNPYGVSVKYVYLGPSNPIATTPVDLTGITGLIKSDGILFSSAVAGTDYVLPSGIRLDAIKPATATNTIDNTLNAQTWNWSTATTQNPLTISASALTTGSALTITPSANAIGITNNGRLVNSVGTTTNTTPILATGSINDFLEVKIKNTSTGTQAQSGFTAEADNGSATTGFAWWGINNSTFNFPTLYNAGAINDVTLVGSGQDLIIANANQTKAIKFQTGKATTPFFDDRMTILNSGNVGIGTITPFGKLQTVLATSNGNVTDWDGNHAVFGQTGSRGSALGIGYDATANESFISTLAPSVAWRPLRFMGAGWKFFINGVTQAFTIASNGSVGVGTATPTSTFENAGSEAKKIVNINTATYTVLATDNHVRLTLAGNQTVTLPSAVGVTGRVYIISNPTGYNKVISSIIGIDQVATTVILSYEMMMIQSDGTNWNKISTSGEKSYTAYKYFTANLWNTGSIIIGNMEFAFNATAASATTTVQARCVGGLASIASASEIVNKTSGGALTAGNGINPAFTTAYSQIAGTAAYAVMDGNYQKIVYYIQDRGNLGTANLGSWEITIMNDGSTNASMKVVYTKP